ncbi:hypothetical protein AF74_11130 [Aliarcobacter butzleri L349]|nr:hypothetical protein AF74_11130 [Aliarcobacter butzleri L349]
MQKYKKFLINKNYKYLKESYKNKIERGNKDE